MISVCVSLLCLCFNVWLAPIQRLSNMAPMRRQERRPQRSAFVTLEMASCRLQLLARALSVRANARPARAQDGALMSTVHRQLFSDFLKTDTIQLRKWSRDGTSHPRPLRPAPYVFFCIATICLGPSVFECIIAGVMAGVCCLIAYPSLQKEISIEYRSIRVFSGT